MSDRSHVSVDKSVQHIIVGWANGDGTITPLNEDAREYINLPKSDTKGITYDG